MSTFFIVIITPYFKGLQPVQSGKSILLHTAEAVFDYHALIDIN